MLSRWIPEILCNSYLRLKVLEQNLQLYGRSPESVMYVSYMPTMGQIRGMRTLLLMA